MNLRAVGGGLAGGLLAGALVGAVEALVVWWGGPPNGALPIGWGVLVYGALGALGGLGLGILAALAGLEGFAVALPAVLCGVGLVVGRFRVIRDVFLEPLPSGPIPLLVQVVAALACLALGVWLWSRLRGVEERRAPVTNPIVAALVVATIGGGWWFAASGTGGAGGPRATGRTGLDTPNVLLLIVDALRADRLSAYGYDQHRTPHIDALAADGLRYTAFAQSSWTRPSVATILTGLYPSSHGAVHEADLLPERVETLAEILAAHGYATVGFPNNADVSDRFNFQQGFAEYHYLAPIRFLGATDAAARLTFYGGLRTIRERFLSSRVNVHHYYQPAEVVTDRVLAWLDGVRPNERFFLYAHYMDPHDPYMVHPFDGQGYARGRYPNPPAELARRFSELYDGEIRHLDQHVGRLVEGLRSRGLYESTMIVFTSDHGEEFHEHGGWWHGTTLYDEQIAVPLIMKPAGDIPRGQVVPGMATSLDIAPTIVAVTGASSPAPMQGQPLPLRAAVRVDRTQVFSEEDCEGNVLQSVRTERWKLITANPGNPRGLGDVELYDLEADPAERVDLATARGAQVEEMQAALGRGVLEARAQKGQGVATEIDAVTKDRLKALGYLE